MEQTTVFDVPPPRAMAPASLEAYAQLVPKLSRREVAVFLLVCDYLAATRHLDVTGAELALWSGRDKTSVRPRLTGLQRKGWLRWGAIRASRAREKRCHPYWPAVPRSAVEALKRRATQPVPPDPMTTQEAL